MPLASATVPFAVPCPVQAPLAKNVNVTSPVGSTPETVSETVALSCTLVPSATDELTGMVAPVVLSCSCVAVDDGAVLTTLVSPASPHFPVEAWLCASPL